MTDYSGPWELDMIVRDGRKEDLEDACRKLKLLAPEQEAEWDLLE
jgi:hypothetical protein